jgi:predicted nucleotidyltransferase
MNDLLKIIAFVKVYHSDVFGVKYFNVDQGKDNLESYFIAKLGWSRYRIDKAIKLLKECGAITKEKADAPHLYSLSMFHKLNLKLL